MKRHESEEAFAFRLVFMTSILYSTVYSTVSIQMLLFASSTFFSLLNICSVVKHSYRM